jgi:hypothetical protein
LDKKAHECEIEMTDEQADWLDFITSFNLKARYTDKIMDQSDALNKAKIYAGLVADKFNPKQIFLFAGTPAGSYAKGNYHTDSDKSLIFVEFV